MTEVKGGRVPLRQRQAQETRRAIAGAARSLFAEHGYAATSIDAVAEEAGVAARTVYAIFGTKKAILGALALYLDFINLFMLLLQLFGQRRQE